MSNSCPTLPSDLLRHDTNDVLHITRAQSAVSSLPNPDSRLSNNQLIVNTAFWVHTLQFIFRPSLTRLHLR